MSCRLKVHEVRKLSECLGASAIDPDQKYDYLIQLIKDQEVDRLWFIMRDGQKIMQRVFYSPSYGRIFALVPYAKKLGLPLSQDLIHQSLDVEWRVPSGGNTPREQIQHDLDGRIMILRKITNALKKYKHPNVATPWDNLLTADIEKVSSQIIERVLNEYDLRVSTGEIPARFHSRLYTTCELPYPCEQVFKQATRELLGVDALPVAYKLIALTTYRPQEVRKNIFIEEILAKIRQCLESKTPLELRWRSSYDVTVNIVNGPDGMSGLVALEYRNCMNGHYYLLIGENHAIWYEDD